MEDNEDFERHLMPAVSKRNMLLYKWRYLKAKVGARKRIKGFAKFASQYEELRRTGQTTVRVISKDDDGKDGPTL